MPNYVKHIAPLFNDLVARPFKRKKELPLGYIGWVGYGNLGDEALYEAICGLLPSHELPSFSAARETVLGGLHLSGPRHFRGVILGGGTIIAPAFLVPVQRTLRLGFPMVSFGTGVGSSGFGDAEHPALDGWQETLNSFELVSVRGPRSFANLTNAGVKSVRVIGDPALSLGPRALPPVDPRRVMAVNLAGAATDTYGVGDCASFPHIAKIAKKHVEGGGVLLPVAMTERDVRFLRDFLADAGLQEVPIKLPRTTDEFIQTILGAEYLIGVRLHSAVLACVVGTIPILLAYRDKCMDFMDSMNLSPLAVKVSAETPQAIDESFAFAQSEPGLREAMFARVQHWRAEQESYAADVKRAFSSAL